MATELKPVFISYAHEDNESPDRSKRWLDRLIQFLQPLVEQDELTICSDQDIGLGEDWHAHIQKHLNGARAAVLLVSPAFLASKYVRNSELPGLLRNAKERGVKIIPVIVRRCLFEETKFKYPDSKTGPEEFTLASIQASNSPSKPLSGMTEDEQDEVLLKVARALLKLATTNPNVDHRPRRGAPPVSHASVPSPPPPARESAMRPRIYISYCTHTRGAAQRIFKLAEALRSAGIDARIDRYYSESLHGLMPPAPRAGQNAWTLWQEEEIQKADRVLIVCDQKYAESPEGSGVALDLQFMQADLDFGAKELGKFIPVGFGPYVSNARFVPKFITGANYYDLSQKGGIEALVRRFRTEFTFSPASEKGQAPAATNQSSNTLSSLMTAKSSNRSIVWLHLSDLHNCKDKTGWDAPRVLRPLIKDLKKMEADHGLAPQILFFTGDTAFGNIGNVAGSTLSEQFDGAHQLLEGARAAFSTAIPQDNVFIVPGNHDVDRDEVTPDQTAWLAAQTQTTTIIDLIRRAGKQWQKYLDRLAAYREFLTRWNYHHLLSDPKRLIYSLTRDLHGLKLGIAGFNSAWSCCENGEKGKLWFGGDWQSGELLNQLSDADFRLAMIHHPFGWFVEQEDTPLRILFEREFAFHLHGHEHLGWVDAKADGHVRVAAAACYDSSHTENGYNFVRLNLDTGEGEVWLRKYDAHGGGWVPRVVAGKTNNDGLWRLGKLPWLQPLIAKAKPANP